MSADPLKLADELDELAAKASAAPWCWASHSRDNTCGIAAAFDENDQPLSGLADRVEFRVGEPVAPEVSNPANAALIVALRNNLPALTAALREAGRMREALERISRCHLEYVEGVAVGEGPPVYSAEMMARIARAALTEQS